MLVNSSIANRRPAMSALFGCNLLKQSGISGQNELIPRQFVPFLSTSAIRANKHFYWWRAVSTVYIMRPNERTLAAIEERKK